MKSKLFFKWVGRWSPREKRLRIFRLIRWVGTVGDGKGHSTMLSLALAPVLYRIEKAWNNFSITVLGLRFHWQRSWGGRHV